MAIPNFWPAEITADNGLEGPVVVLKEQAALLGQTTKNLVEAQVESDSEDNSGLFVDRFVIYSAVINYRYELFSVRYPFEFYPATIWWDGYPNTAYIEVEDGDYETPIEQSRIVNSRREIEEELKNIFAHPKTIRIIQAIMARSRE